MANLLFPALLFLVMYFALIRPQQRQAKEARQLLASLEVGDEVITTSGIHGFINSLEDTVVWLEIAADVELKMSRTAIAGKISDDPEPVSDDDDEDEPVQSGLGDTDEID